MEDLIAEFTFLSNQALHDKNFDPSNIQDLMKLFEVEAYKSWAAMELECQNEAQSAEFAMEEAELELKFAMDNAMEEFRKLEEEEITEREEAVEDSRSKLEKEAMAEYHSLVSTAEAARSVGKRVEKAATLASNKYIEAALGSATNTMRSAWKGISSHKVHPS